MSGHRAGPVRPLPHLLGRVIVTHVCRGCGERVSTYDDKEVPAQPRPWREADWCGCSKGRKKEARP